MTKPAPASDAPPAPPIAGAQPKSALVAFGDGGLQLNTMEQAFIFAKAVIASGLAPKDFRSAEAVLIAVQMGAEIGLAPMASLQNIAVINGKPGVYGDAGKALLRAKGFDIEELDTGAIKAGGFAKCTVTHPRQKPVTRTFSIEDARTAGLWGKQGPWTQYPYRQMAWRAFWFAARDAASDVLKGLVGAEEQHDIPAEPKNVTPPPPAARLLAIDAPPAETGAATPAEATVMPPEGKVFTQSSPTATKDAEPVTPGPADESRVAPAPAFEGDKQSLVDVIEGLMLDLQIPEERLVSEAIKAGHKLPAKLKKLTDLSEETLKFMLGHLKEQKK